MATASYALGLGSNRRHGRHGAPWAVLHAAVAALAAEGLTIRAMSPIFATAPIGAGIRRYANAALIVETPLAPPAMLALAKRIERSFGRRRGRRWGDRVLDIDLLLWSGGPWQGTALTIPHRNLAHRRFVLDPLVRIAAGWRAAGPLRIRHLNARLMRVDRQGAGP